MQSQINAIFCRFPQKYHSVSIQYSSQNITKGIIPPPFHKKYILKVLFNYIISIVIIFLYHKIFHIQSVFQNIF